MEPSYFDSNPLFPSLRLKIGENSPAFAHRLLWIHNTCRYRVSDDFEVFLPIVLDREYCKQIIDHGYNIVVFAGRNSKETKNISLQDLQGYLDHIRSTGIKIALEVGSSCQNPQMHLKSACELYGSIDFLLCRQNWLADRGYAFRKTNPTKLEKVIEELSFTEEHSKIPILYATAQGTEEASHLLALTKTISSKSMITFYAQRSVGDLHPIFSELSRFPAVIESRLVPLLQVSQYQLDEDVWFSDFPFQLVEDALGRQVGNRFCAAGCCIEDLPLPGAFAECPIWAIGKKMSQPTSIYGHVESWVERYHASCQKIFKPLLLQQIHTILLQLRFLDEHIQNRASLQAKRTIDRLCYELKIFSEDLTDFREEWRYRDVGASLESLSSYLYDSQLYVKKIIEKASQSIGSKIPLLLQEFIPVRFYL